MALGKSAAENAAALSGEGTVEMRRAQLYRAAALAVSADPAGPAELDRVDAGGLPDRDRELLGAVLAVVAEIRQWPEVAGEVEPPPVEVSNGAPAEGTSAPAPDVVAPAQDAVLAAKRLLVDADS